MKFKIKQLIKMMMQHLVLPFLYFINRWRKIDDGLVVLADAHHDCCPPHIMSVRASLIEENFKVKDYFFDLEAMGTIKGFAKLCGFMKYYASAGTVIICDYFLPVAACNKKKKTRVIQLWHAGGAFKKFGYDATDDIPAMYKGRVHKNYSLVTVSGERAVKPFEGAMGLDNMNIVKPYGICETDKLYDEKYIALCKEKLMANYPDAKGKRIVLWAPTFRGNAASAKLLGEDVIDRAKTELMSEDIYIIKSLHPHMLAPGEVSKMTTNELLVVADLLITDYSSVFFDYLLIDKPIIFFAIDYKEYYNSRGFYLDYDKLPGVIIKDKSETELLSSIRESLLDDKYAEQRKQFSSDYMSGCDGHVTERIVDYVRHKEDI